MKDAYSVGLREAFFSIDAPSPHRYKHGDVLGYGTQYQVEILSIYVKTIIWCWTMN